MAAQRSRTAGTLKPTPAASAPRRPRVLEVELTRFVDDDAEDGDDPVTWHAEWALRDASVATEDSGTDLSELIDSVIGDAAAQWGSRYGLPIEWELSSADRLPEGQTIEGIVEDLGVTLPRGVPASL